MNERYTSSAEKPNKQATANFEGREEKKIEPIPRSEIIYYGSSAPRVGIGNGCFITRRIAEVIAKGVAIQKPNATIKTEVK